MNFLNLHVLISHSPSCLNRDDMNMQKSATFGGVRRVRVSSQSLKRAIRTSPQYQTAFGAPSIRTRELKRMTERLIEELKDEFEPSEIQFAAESFVKAVKDSGEDETDEQDIDEEPQTGEQKKDKKLAVAPWSVSEMREICRVIEEVKCEGLQDKERDAALKKVGKSVGKGKEKRKLTEEDCLAEAMSKKVIKRLKDKAALIAAAMASTLDIALSGRMATSGLMTSVDGALAVAHALTTHAVDADIDWFTAVDDLLVDEGEVGAGHLDTQEFSSGVFYRYASLNIGQLQKNLGDVSRERALEVASHLVQLFATVTPSGKQQTFAAHNVADLVAVTFAELPLSLANAFEKPVQEERHGGFREPSAKALSQYWQSVHQGYGLNERTAGFSTLQACLGERKDTLGDLRAWIVRDGQ